MHFGFFVLLLSTDCYSQPASALHSHISMCKFDLFLGKYHQTESCFWASPSSKGTRSFSSQVWCGMLVFHQLLSCLSLQCSVGMIGLVAKALGTVVLFESKNMGFWKISECKWNGDGTPPHPFLGGWGGNSEMSLGVELSDVHDLKMGSSHRERQSTVKVPESFTNAAFS